MVDLPPFTLYKDVTYRAYYLTYEKTFPLLASFFDVYCHRAGAGRPQTRRR